MNDLKCYSINGKMVISMDELNARKTSLEALKSHDGIIHAINNIPGKKARRCFSISSFSNLFIKDENLNILRKEAMTSINAPEILVDKIKEGKACFLNKAYKSYEDVLNDKAFPCSIDLSPNKKHVVNVVGLGDVGTTLVTGLRMLGHDCISRIGIYDRDPNKSKRVECECNQIAFPDLTFDLPDVVPIGEEEMFKCDMFVFCVSLGVPSIGNEEKDVRLVQFEGNARIIGEYSKKASDSNYKGIFAVVSDPVDLLCRAALDSGTSLLPEQIRGYGLGVMNARAAFFAKRKNVLHFMQEGRIFGPHGEGMIVADSIERYDEELSEELTKLAKEANLMVRSTGFKPYIAPAMSSGALSIISTLKGQWHYSANFIGGTYVGCRNRLTPAGVELETYDFDERLFKKLSETYDMLETQYSNYRIRR